LLFTVAEGRLAEVASALGDDDRPTVVGRVVGLHPGGRLELMRAGRVVEPGRPGYVAF
jgi:hypothetical protein